MDGHEPASLATCQRELDAALAARDTVLALFYTSWCPFCTPFLPLFQEAAARQGLPVLLCRDDQEQMASLYAVEVYPTVLAFQGKAVAGRLDGVLGVGLSAQALEAFLEGLP